MEKQCTDSLLVSFDIDSLSIESLRQKYRSLLAQQRELELAYLKDQLVFAEKLLEAKTKCNELESQLHSTTHSYHELEKERDKLWKYAAETLHSLFTRGYAWQPMEKSPKDGTVVLLRVPSSEHGMLLAFWSDPSIGDTELEDAGWYENEWSGTSITQEITGWRL